MWWICVENSCFDVLAAVVIKKTPSLKSNNKPKKRTDAASTSLSLFLFLFPLLLSLHFSFLLFSTCLDLFPFPTHTNKHAHSFIYVYADGGACCGSLWCHHTKNQLRFMKEEERTLDMCKRVGHRSEGRDRMQVIMTSRHRNTPHAYDVSEI